jgi:glycosyltransferase involved in cell wall biosynthesis
MNGPVKLFANLVRGLDKIGYPYAINHALHSTARIWVQDDLTALRHLRDVSSAAVVLGPNLFNIPSDIPDDLDFQGCLYVQPSGWIAQVWREAGFNDCPIAVWPVGVDTELLQPSAGTSRDEVLIYHKSRPEEELRSIVRMLQDSGHLVRVIRYGSYREDQLLDAAARAQAVVWHGMHETQGLALQETMALDVPVVLYDAPVQDVSCSGYEVTAAPYWDDRCGIKVQSIDEVPDATQRILDNRSDFAPREFVTERLSLEAQARAFVDLWEHFGLSWASGLEEKLRSRRRWPPPRDRLLLAAKSSLRPLLVELLGDAQVQTLAQRWRGRK